MMPQSSPKIRRRMPARRRGHTIPRTAGSYISLATSKCGRCLFRTGKSSRACSAEMAHGYRQIWLQSRDGYRDFCSARIRRERQNARPRPGGRKCLSGIRWQRVEFQIRETSGSRKVQKELTSKLDALPTKKNGAGSTGGWRPMAVIGHL